MVNYSQCIRRLAVEMSTMFLLVSMVGCGGGSDFSASDGDSNPIADPSLAAPCTVPTEQGKSIYQYDKNGQLIRLCQGATAIDYSYDSAGNITAIKSS